MKSANFRNLNIISFEPVKSNRDYWKHTYHRNMDNWRLAHPTDNEAIFNLFECALGVTETDNDKNTKNIIDSRNITIVPWNQGVAKIDDNVLEHDPNRKSEIDQLNDIINKEIICLTELDYVIKHYMNEYNINYKNLMIPLLKIDTEGFELNVLKSGMKLIRNRKILCIKTEFRPVFIEENNGVKAIDYLLFLRDNGYDIYLEFDDSHNGLFVDNSFGECKFLFCPFKYKIDPAEFEQFVDLVRKSKSKQVDFFAVLAIEH